MQINNLKIIPKHIIDFWFDPKVKPLWFSKNEKFDKLIKDKFLSLYEQAASGELDTWKATSEGILALVIVLDQFPRNMFRNNPKSFASDDKALSCAKEAIQKNLDKNLNEEQKHFLYMPFMHSEHLEDQELSLKLFHDQPEAYKYAKAHYDIIKRFGRFPHRNKILNRSSTPEELEFLKQPNSSF
jgi:uncharacterized protein (DUF924 family)